MHGVEFLQATEERIHIRRRPRLRNALLPLFAIGGWLALVAWLDPFTMGGLVALGCGFGTLRWWVPMMAFAVRVKDVTLIRSGPVLMLDGEPLEAARVETRVIPSLFGRQTRGYVLSLWVLATETGSKDLELGRFRTLLDASQAAGVLEGFLALAAMRPKRSNVT